MFLDDWDKALETILNIAWALMVIGAIAVIFTLGVIVGVIMF